MHAKYQLGRIAVSIEGEGPLADEVSAELKSCPPATDDPLVQYRFVDRLPQAEYVQNGDILMTEDGVRIARPGGLIYEPRLVDERLIVTIAAKPSRRGDGLGAISRFRDWNYLSRPERLAKNFMYGLFDWTTQISQVKHGQSYMHASSMERGDRGVAILGWGGVGKTTSLLKLCLEEGWSYLSDDLGLIGQDGTMFRAPKRLQVYGYNTEGEPGIRDALLGRRPLIDRLSWLYHERRYGKNRVRRRVSAEDLFGKNLISVRAKLTDILYLERGSRPVPEIVPTDAEEMATRMSAVVMSEIEPYATLHRQSTAAGTQFFEPPHEVEERTRTVLGQAFSGARIFKIRVGQKPRPDVLARIIGDHLDRLA